VIVCRFYKSDQTRESTGRNRPATDYLRFTCMKPNMGMQNGSRFSQSQEGLHTGNARLQGE